MGLKLGSKNESLRERSLPRETCQNGDEMTTTYSGGGYLFSMIFNIKLCAKISSNTSLALP